MKVLRVISHLNVGGVQRQLLLIFRALREIGVECSVCCIDKRGSLEENFRDEGFPVHYCRFNSRLDPIARLRLRALVMSYGYDVVHSHMYSANMSTNSALIYRRRVGLVNGYHNQIFVSSNRQKKKVVKSANGPFTPFSIGRPDALVAVGENVRVALIEAGIHVNRVKTITNGVIGPDEAIPLPETKPGEPLRVMWAGRFVSQKRADFLVEVAEACKNTNVPMKLTLYGEGPKWYAIRNMVNEKGLQDVVHMPGVVSDIYEAHRENEIYASASYREGFPNALLEACIAGRPVLVSDIDPHLEVLKDKGAGYILPVETEKWVAAIREIIDKRDGLKQMAENARNTGLEHHISKTAERMKEFYEQVQKKRGSWVAGD